jgi:hypothetical protein
MMGCWLGDGRIDLRTLPNKQTKTLRRFVSIVGGATQLEIFNGCRTAPSERKDVMKLEQRCFSASSGWSLKSTAAAIACPDRTANVGRHMSRSLAGVW